LVAISDARGAFVVDELEEGPWLLRADDGRSLQAEASGVISRSGGDRRAWLVLHAGASIAGVVRTEHGKLPEGLVIRARASSPAPSKEQQEERRLHWGEDPDPAPQERRSSWRDADLQREHEAVVGPDGAFVLSGLLHDAQYRLAPYLPRRGCRDLQLSWSGPEVAHPGGSRGEWKLDDHVATVRCRVLSATDDRPLRQAQAWIGQDGDWEAWEDVEDDVVVDWPEGLVAWVGYWVGEAGAKVSFRVAAPLHEDHAWADLQLEPGETLDLGVVRLRRGAQLEVQLLGAETREPLPGLLVSMVPLDAGHDEGGEHRMAGRCGPSAQSIPDRSSTSDANGIARLPVLPGATVRIDGEFEAFKPVQLQHRFGSGGDERLELLLHPRSKLEIVVVDSAGRGVEGCHVAALEVEPSKHEDQWSASARSNGRGIVSFTGLEPGLYRARVERFGGDGSFWSDDPEVEELVEATEWREVRVESDRVSRLELLDFERAAVVGRLNLDGRPMSHARVMLAPWDPMRPHVWLRWSEEGGALQAMTDADGAFALERVPLGNWRLFAAADGVVHPLETLVAVDAGANRVEVDWITSSISGRVLDFEGRPLARARVLVHEEQVDEAEPGYPILSPAEIDFAAPAGSRLLLGATGEWEESNGPEVDSVVTDAEGRWSLRGVRPGVRLELLAEHRWHARGRKRGIVVPHGESLEGIDIRLAAGGDLLLVPKGPMLDRGDFIVCASRNPDAPEDLGPWLWAMEEPRTFSKLPVGEWNLRFEWSVGWPGSTVVAEGSFERKVRIQQFSRAIVELDPE